MLKTILSIFKYSILFLVCFYGYIKLTKGKFGWINLLDLLAAIGLSTALYFATSQLRVLFPICFLLFSCLYILLRVRRSVLNTVTISVISCGIAILTMTFAFIFSIPIEYILFLTVKDETILTTISLILMVAIQLLLTFLIFKIKRFKNGITTNANDGSIEVLLLTSILAIFIYSVGYTDNLNNQFVFEIMLLILIFCGLALIFVWRKHITNAYHKKIYDRNEAIYEQRITAYEQDKEDLLNQNAELAKIIHRDNKLIPAMVMAVKELIATVPQNEELNALLEQLEELSAEHKEIIDSYQATTDILPKTNSIPIDAVLHYILSKAKQNNIEFNVTVAEGCIPALLSKTAMTDLTTILCDLGENAVIATKNVPDGKILVSFEYSEAKHPCICFYDNGALFDEKVIANMGKRKITTHKNDGGSGIGLMTLFEILNKYNASYCLDERQTEQFTKRIQLTFDNLNKVEILK